MEFSESEDEDDKHMIKNAAQYLQFKPEEGKGSKKNEVNMNKYFDFFQNKHAPNIARYNKKWEKQRNWNAQAIPMTGKNTIKRNDDNEEDEWPPIIGPMYELKMRQAKAKIDRDRFKTNQNDFSLD